MGYGRKGGRDDGMLGEGWGISDMYALEDGTKVGNRVLSQPAGRGDICCLSHADGASCLACSADAVRILSHKDLLERDCIPLRQLNNYHENTEYHFGRWGRILGQSDDG